MSAAALPDSASDAIARMAADVAPYTQLVLPRPTMLAFLLRHGPALLRLSGPVVRMFVDIRTRLGGARNADDVWTAVEQMYPRAKRIVDLLRDDGWAERVRDIPRPTPGRFTGSDREVSNDRLAAKYEYFVALFRSSPYTGRGRSRATWRREVDVPPVLRRIGGYTWLMPTLLLVLDLDAMLPTLSDEVRSVAHCAANDALEQLISFALAIGGQLDPPPGITLPEPMPILKLYDDWERVLQLRRASDVAS